MAKQRYIDTRFWDDCYIQSLKPEEKLLFIYCFTNALTNIAGIYEISLKRIAFDTGIDTLSIGHILKKFEKEKKIFLKNGWLIITNFPKYQEWEKSPKIKQGIELILAKIPDKVKYSIDTLSIPYTYPLNYSNTNSNTNNIYGAKAPKDKYMYTEPVIELDENGETITKEIAPKTPKGFAIKLMQYYKAQFNVPETKGQFFGYKPTIDSMIDLAKKIHGNDFTKIEAEIKARIDIAKNKAKSENWGKMKLSTILENWNNLSEWRKNQN